MNTPKPSVYDPISHFVRQPQNQAHSLVNASHLLDDKANLSKHTDDQSAPIVAQSAALSEDSGDRTLHSADSINPSTHPIVLSGGITDDTQQTNNPSAHSTVASYGVVNPVADTIHLSSGISDYILPHHRPYKTGVNSSLDAAPSPKDIAIQSLFHVETAVTDSRIRKTIELIRENLHLPISLEKLARQVNLSASRLRSLFCQIIGIPLAQFIRLFRLERARQLLGIEFLTIKEVMARTGIHDPSHFNRDFKLAYGLTPMQYRNQSKCFDSQTFSVSGSREARQGS